jgi:hypothetical protein
MEAPDNMWDALVLVGVVAGAITGAAGVLSLLRKAFQTTVGRRLVLTRKLERLAPAMQMGYFTDVLGEPQQRQVSEQGRQLAAWAWEDAYAQAVAAPGGAVTQWSVTTRIRRFSPTFYRGRTITPSGETLEVTLGRTTFSELPGRPQWIRGSVGARRFHYDEGYYFGNPGNYQTYVYSLNDAGYVNDDALVRLSIPEEGLSAGGDREIEVLMGRPEVAAARATAAVNTITVGAPYEELDPDDTWLGYGPDADVVRVVPDTSLAARWQSWRRSVAARLKRWMHARSRSWR